MEQLDEHLSGKVSPRSPSIILIGGILFIYCMILVISVVLYYTVFEFSGLLDASIFKETIYGIIIRDLVVILSIEFIVILSNYYLQSQLYKLFHQSIAKTTLIPILFWIGIIFSFLVSILYEGLYFPTLYIFSIRISIVIILYSTLSFTIAQYFKHQNSLRYYSFLFLHWLLSIAIIHYLP